MYCKLNIMGGLSLLTVSVVFSVLLALDGVDIYHLALIIENLALIISHLALIIRVDNRR